MGRRESVFVLVGVMVGGLTGCAAPSNPLREEGRATSAPCPPAWSVVSSANVGEGDNELVAVSGGSSTNVWAVGTYMEPGDEVSFSLAEHWDGSVWTVVPSPNIPGVSNFLTDVEVVGPNDVWAVGYAQDVGFPGGNAVTLTEHWDGEAWTIIPSPNPGNGDNQLFGAKAFGPLDVWAVGQARIAGIDAAITFHWTGEEWIDVPGPDADSSGDYLWAIDGSASDDIWASGYYFDPDFDLYQPLVGHWDGSAWSAYQFPRLQVESQGLGLVTIEPGDAWAVGRTGFYDQQQSSLAALHWDGLQWDDNDAEPQNQGDLDILSSVTAFSGADVWAAGYYTEPPTDVARPLVEHWDGVSPHWSVVDLPDPGPGDAKVAGITRIPGVSELWAVGSSTDEATGALRTWALQDCPIDLGEMGFSPDKARVQEPGTMVDWSMPAGGTSHEIVDGTGLGLFDSGPKTPPASYSTSFFASGTYRVLDEGTGDVMQLAVSARASPRSGDLATRFRIIWATHKAFGTQTFDVQVRRPGSSTYEDWVRGRRPSARFTPDSGSGVYSFRARLRDTATGAMAGYSPAVSIVVS